MNSYKNITCVTAPIIFTSDDIYAAQCLWEAHLEKEVINKKLEQCHEEYGTVHMREELCRKDILDALYEGFQIAQFAGFDDCFDWQYVPFFYSYCLTSSKFDDRICLAPNWGSVRYFV